jgi:hypothetical protein
VSLRLVAFAAAVAVAGCSGERGRVPEVDPEALAREVDRIAAAELAFYWPGRSAEGFPLTHAELNGTTRAVFGYGTCELPEGEGGCAVPAQVQNFPFRAADWGRAVGCTRVPDVRGVPAVRHDSLVVFTATTVVKIYAPHPRRVAASLRKVGAPSSGRPLPPPRRSVTRLLDRVCGRP